jgi:hypothetical protein
MPRPTRDTRASKGRGSRKITTSGHRERGALLESGMGRSKGGNPNKRSAPQCEPFDLLGVVTTFPTIDEGEDEMEEDQNDDQEDGQEDGQADGQEDGQADGQEDGQADGQEDGQADSDDSEQHQFPSDEEDSDEDQDRDGEIIATWNDENTNTFDKYFEIEQKNCFLFTMENPNLLLAHVEQILQHKNELRKNWDALFKLARHQVVTQANIQPPNEEDRFLGADMGYADRLDQDKTRNLLATPFSNVKMEDNDTFWTEESQVFSKAFENVTVHCQKYTDTVKNVVQQACFMADIYRGFHLPTLLYPKQITALNAHWMLETIFGLYPEAIRVIDAMTHVMIDNGQVKIKVYKNLAIDDVHSTTDNSAAHSTSSFKIGVKDSIYEFLKSKREGMSEDKAMKTYENKKFSGIFERTSDDGSVGNSRQANNLFSLSLSLSTKHNERKRTNQNATPNKPDQYKMKINLLSKIESFSELMEIIEFDEMTKRSFKAHNWCCGRRDGAGSDYDDIRTMRNILHTSTRVLPLAVWIMHLFLVNINPVTREGNVKGNMKYQTLPTKKTLLGEERNAFVDYKKDIMNLFKLERLRNGVTGTEIMVPPEKLNSSIRYTAKMKMPLQKWIEAIRREEAYVKKTFETIKDNIPDWLLKIYQETGIRNPLPHEDPAKVLNLRFDRRKEIKTALHTCATPLFESVNDLDIMLRECFVVDDCPDFEPGNGNEQEKQKQRLRNAMHSIFAVAQQSDVTLEPAEKDEAMGRGRGQSSSPGENNADNGAAHGNGLDLRLVTICETCERVENRVYQMLREKTILEGLHNHGPQIEVIQKEDDNTTSGATEPSPSPGHNTDESDNDYVTEASEPESENESEGADSDEDFSAGSSDEDSDEGSEEGSEEGGEEGSEGGSEEESE